MNRRILCLTVVLLVVLVAAVGCRKSIPLESYSGGVAVENATPEKAKTAIMRAGASLGWVIAPSGDNKLEGTLRVRAHTLVVDIDYSSTRYTIRHKSSTNLDYQGDQIHPQYRNWVLNLQRHIDAEMAAANTR